MHTAPPPAAPPRADLTELFDRARAGDESARNELLAGLYDRIIRLSAAVLRTFPVVGRRRQAESVANDLVLKLIAALDEGLSARTATEFFRFAGTRLRQLLIDEADKLRRRDGLCRVLSFEAVGADAPGGEFDPGTELDDPAELAERAEFWDRFRGRLDGLPAEEARVVELHFLMQMPQSAAARVLGWEPKQVSRRWLSAARKLADPSAN